MKIKVLSDDFIYLFIDGSKMMNLILAMSVINLSID